MATNDIANFQEPIPVADGGTGASSLTNGGILLGSGTDPVTAMSVLAKGSLVVGDGSTDPTELTAGANDTIIVADSSQSSGLRAKPGGNGAWSLVSSTTVSNDSSLDFTGISANNYMIVCRKLLAATGASQLYLRASTDNGVSWLASNDYQTCGQCLDQGGTATTRANTSTDQFNVSSGVDLGNDTASDEYGFSGIIWVFGLNNASLPAFFLCQGTCINDTTPLLNTIMSAGATYISTAENVDIDAIQLLAESGNLASGVVNLYQWLEA